MLVAETASSGVPELDEALGGLYWGDNVVWQTDERGDVGPFYEAVAKTAASYHSAAIVTVARDPAEVSAAYPGLTVVDARPSTSLGQPGPLLATLAEVSENERRALVLFESLDAMAANWGSDTARRFFTRTCPMLLELSAIAYWSFTPSAHPATTRREIEDTTQCVIAIGDGRLRIGKAEGRPSGVQGSVFRFRVDDGTVTLERAPGAARLGAALLALRTNRGLSQAAVARLAGVSPSAISQAERGQRGLSLETLLGSREISASRSTSSSAARSHRGTGSPAGTTRSSGLRGGRCRSSTTPPPAFAPTSCGSSGAARRRPSSRTRA